LLNILSFPSPLFCWILLPPVSCVRLTFFFYADVVAFLRSLVKPAAEILPPFLELLVWPGGTLTSDLISGAGRFRHPSFPFCTIFSSFGILESFSHASISSSFSLQVASFKPVHRWLPQRSKAEVPSPRRASNAFRSGGVSI